MDHILQSSHQTYCQLLVIARPVVVKVKEETRVMSAMCEFSVALEIIFTAWNNAHSVNLILQLVMLRLETFNLI